MVDHLSLRQLPVVQQPVEIVERKGIGHPDTICDALPFNLRCHLQSLQYTVPLDILPNAS
jgi:S-adenosylmethionine synthetase